MHIYLTYEDYLGFNYLSNQCLNSLQFSFANNERVLNGFFKRFKKDEK